MLYRKIKHFFSVKTNVNTNKQPSYINFKLKKQQWIAEFLALVKSTENTFNMSSGHKFRLIFRDFAEMRLWGMWARSVIVSSMLKKCKKDRVIEFLQCFRQTFLKPRRTLLLSVTAAYKVPRSHVEEKYDDCSIDITDEELETLMTDLDYIEELFKNTLYCKNCGKRLIIDKKLPGITYCSCGESKAPLESEDGWVPYLEAEDVVIWRKEYKKGQGLYAYKVYGLYKDVQASHFAAIQLDVGYRRRWDDAVAALTILEKQARGVSGQALLHWEVQWPRLFKNRDYVYLRRHKQFDVVHRAHSGSVIAELPRPSPPSSPSSPSPPSPPSFTGAGDAPSPPSLGDGEVPSSPSLGAGVAPSPPPAHSDPRRAPRKDHVDSAENRVYVIVSRSCKTPLVPETHAVRVTEYWSHMIVRTVRGLDKPGMEFVLTYYDEPAVGGLPRGVSGWAAGRAAPDYLRRMRAAARAYTAYLHARRQLSEARSDQAAQSMTETRIPDEESNDIDLESNLDDVGPLTDRGTRAASINSIDSIETEQKVDVQSDVDASKNPNTLDKAEDMKEGEEEKDDRGWYRYLYPFYYFL